jgi:hypothetical protein
MCVLLRFSGSERYEYKGLTGVSNTFCCSVMLHFRGRPTLLWPAIK